MNVSSSENMEKIAKTFVLYFTRRPHLLVLVVSIAMWGIIVFFARFIMSSPY